MDNNWYFIYFFFFRYLLFIVYSSKNSSNIFLLIIKYLYLYCAKLFDFTKKEYMKETQNSINCNISLHLYCYNFQLLLKMIPLTRENEGRISQNLTRNALWQIILSAERKRNSVGKIQLDEIYFLCTRNRRHVQW